MKGFLCVFLYRVRQRGKKLILHTLPLVYPCYRLIHRMTHRLPSVLPSTVGCTCTSVPAMTSLSSRQTDTTLELCVGRSLVIGLMLVSHFSHYHSYCFAVTIFAHYSSLTVVKPSPEKHAEGPTVKEVTDFFA